MRVSRLILIIMVSGLIWGCKIDPYCINCPEQDSGTQDTNTTNDQIGGDDTGSQSDTEISDEITHPDACDPSFTEICNNFDDNCNNEIDEGFDLNTDPNNCGACGHKCELSHAFSECTGGSCAIKQCDVGYYNLDGRDDTGCEYSCIPVEVDTSEYCQGPDCCDGRDNDCDGTKEEDHDVLNDPLHCGDCKTVCHFPYAIEACEAGECKIADCEEGYYNFDGDVETGCEYKCTPNPETNGEEICNNRDDNCNGEIDEGITEPCESICGTGVRRCEYGIMLPCDAPLPGREVCDGIDNDCDDDIDEDTDKNSDPRNCKTCGNICSFPNAIPRCNNGECELAACLSGYFDFDPAQPGCETQCVYSGQEVCDGKDNDCNGETDTEDSAMFVPDNYCGRFGVCQNITPVCQGTKGLVCSYPDNYEVQEVSCDEADNDCDGLTDEGFDVGIAFPCAVGQGECRREGHYVCGNGSRVCNVSEGPIGTEVCNGKDDNCDGTVDNVSIDNMEVVHITGVDSDLNNDGSVSGDELNRSFYMFQYEASRPDASSSEVGNMSGHACSNEAVVPWTVVSWSEARDSCCGLNSDGQCHTKTINVSGGTMTVPQYWGLCLAGDWEVVCQRSEFTSTSPSSAGVPYIYPYGDQYQQLYCNGYDYVPASCPDGGHDCLVTTGSLTQCVSQWNSNEYLYDMSGNAYEWTYTGYVIGGETYYEYRGGSYKNPQYGLSCQFDFNLGINSEEFTLDNLGFRCCYY